jgi:Ca2+-binding EF-hand superfamily protein
MSNKEKAKIKILFDKYDDNKNGVLEKSEFIKGFIDLVKEIESDMNDNEVKKVAEEAIIKFDLNGNGIIEFNEFCELISFLKNEKGLNL